MKRSKVIKQIFSVIKISILFVLPIVLMSCDQRQKPIDITQLKIIKYIPFDQFIADIQKAEYKDYVKMPGSKVLNEDEFQRMKNHIITLYEGVKVKNSFVMDSVMFVDCIDINTQPGLRLGKGKYATLQQPPPAITVKNGSDTSKALPVKPMLDKEKKDQFGNTMFCEQGFIPMRRITLKEITRFKTLDDFFNKAGRKGYKGIPDVK